MWAGQWPGCSEQVWPGQMWHCLANVLKPSENRGSSAMLSYQSQSGIASPGRNLSDSGLDSVWKKPEYWQVLSMDGCSWHRARKDGWFCRLEVTQQAKVGHSGWGASKDIQAALSGWVPKWPAGRLQIIVFQGQARFAKQGATAAWRLFGEVVPPGVGQPSLQPCTEIKCVPWRWQIWILIHFPLAQLASSLGSTIQYITFEIFLISSLYFTASQRSFLEFY